MSGKRAFLVLGPESSGTRLMTSLLIAAGCTGDAGHVQRLDAAMLDDPLIVWRRSLPHGGKWPDIAQLSGQLDHAGYSVTAIVMSRDWHAMARSQVAARHVPDEATATSNIRRAYRLIFDQLPDAPFELVNYEALIQRPQQVAAHFTERWGLAMPTQLDIYDGNAKYYGDHTRHAE